MARFGRSKMTIRVLIISALAAAQAVSCSVKENIQKMKLVWVEEFNYSGLLDPKMWGYEVGFIRNQEAQYYTEGRLENGRVEDGCLVIESRKESFAGARYTSASVNTLGKMDFFYGRIEVRAKIPTGVGSWPAIWMMGTDIPRVSWPECGEIDIMENVGYEPNRIYATVHTPGSVYNPGLVTRGGHVDIPSPFADFHVYAIEWRSNRIDFFLDGQKYFTYMKDIRYPDYWRFDKPFYLLLNTAIGGNWGGEKGIDDSIFPLKYYIDYVKYYQWE
jgi:beta-glucanase (GH16 family)